MIIGTIQEIGRAIVSLIVSKTHKLHFAIKYIGYILLHNGIIDLQSRWIFVNGNATERAKTAQEFRLQTRGWNNTFTHTRLC